MPLRKIEFATNAAGTDAREHSWVSWSDTEVEISPIDFQGRQISEVYFRVTSPSGVASTWFGPVDYMSQMSYRLTKEDLLDNDEIDFNFINLNYKPEFYVGNFPLTATGGTVTEINVGGIDYKVHTFITNGIFEVTSGSGYVEYLIVGGGGAGGPATLGAGGGGSGGDVVHVSAAAVSVNEYTVVIGQGGEATTTSAGSGGNSTFLSSTALGGGYGGWALATNVAPIDGGGAGQRNAGDPTGGAAHPTEFSGGSAFRAGIALGQKNAGGGRGTGGNGGNATSDAAGVGGVGVSSSITGTAVVYGSGGDGGRNVAIGTPDDPTAPGTGGGGASQNGSAETAGASGGSGIVIIRYRFRISAQNTQTNILIENAFEIPRPTGNPINSQKLFLRLKDDGTARDLTWDPVWRGVGLNLPTETTANKTMYIGAIWNSTDFKWDVVGVSEEL
jgi:hypothetical protein